MGIQSPLGMQDILPEDVPFWKAVESAAHKVCALYGYSEIRTPLFEFTSLFTRSVGEVTDIVEKEMYTFVPDAAESDSVTLRPEFTAGIVRAYLQHNMHKQRAFRKFYALGPLFRRERPQKGRYRQFHQFDIEAIGSNNPYLDAETILLASDFLKELGLNEYRIFVNSIGCPSCRAVYREAVKEELAPRRGELCPNCQSRYERNVFRIMDCKAENCRAIVSKLSPIQKHLCNDCRAHFNTFSAALESSGVAFTVNPLLVRGFDYYTKTIYEFTYPSALGAQDAILGGGRYDNLVEELGGPKLGAVGFAAGIERIILAMKSLSANLTFDITASKQPSPVFVAAVTDNERKNVFEIMTDLRRHKISADIDYESKSIKAQMKNADRLSSSCVLIVGPDEAKAGKVKMKMMNTGEEKTIEQKEIIGTILHCAVR